MQVDASFNTTFDTDEEARIYGRAVAAVMRGAAMDIPPEQWNLIRDWSLECERKAGVPVDALDSRVLIFMTVVAPGRILLAVAEHFGILADHAGAPPPPWSCCGCQ